MLYRTCKDCKVEKLIDNFALVGKRHYRRSRCAECYKIYNATKKRKNYTLEKNREWMLKRNYNMTLEDYNSLLEQQNYACAICGFEETKTYKNGTVASLAVDHDHECCPGSTSCGDCVRGLLCYRCNTMIGFAYDNATILEMAGKYLRNWYIEAK